MSDFEALKKRPIRGGNSVIELEKLMRHFDLGSVPYERGADWCGLDPISTPWTIYVREQHCKQFDLELLETELTDTLLWQKVSQVVPSESYLGDRPYFPDLTSKQAAEAIVDPLEFEFMVQLNFTDSRDLLSFCLPASCLQVYVKKDEDGSFYLGGGKLKGVWVDWTENALSPIAGDHRPFCEGTFQGVICRLRENVGESDRILSRADEGDLDQGFGLSVVHGTKIAGSPWDTQDFQYVEYPDGTIFLCQIYSFFHFGNLAQMWEGMPDVEEFMIGDASGILLFMTKEGEVIFDGALV